MMTTPAQTDTTQETEFAKANRLSKEDANYQNLADVSYGDLNHFIGNCRRLKDKDSFDTAIRILEAIRDQVLGKKK